MKQLTILSGRCLVVELPSWETIEKELSIHGHDEGLTESEFKEYVYSKCPPGNWRITGMLSEMTESEAAQIVKLHATIKKYRDYLIDNDRPTDMFTKTALESLDSAIVAEGYAFQSAPKPENKDFFWGYLDDLAKWEAAQSRVLDRSRCLLLRRVEG